MELIPKEDEQPTSEGVREAAVDGGHSAREFDGRSADPTSH